MTFLGNIASQYLQARIAAFDRAHHVLRLCKACLAREVAARRVTPMVRRGDSAEVYDPVREWCFHCGGSEPTLPALPRAVRPSRRVA